MMERQHNRGVLIRTAIVVIILCGFTAAWHLTSLKEWLDVGKLTAAAILFRNSPISPIIILLAYLIAGLIMFPISLVILVTIVIFGPLKGFVYTLIGLVGSSILTYAVGKLISVDKACCLGRKHVDSVMEELAHHGVVAMMIVRIVPVAPFTVINLVAGAMRVPFKDYLLGTLLGTLPGLILITIFERQLEDLFEKPGEESLVILGLTMAAIMIITFGIRQMLRARIKH